MPSMIESLAQGIQNYNGIVDKQLQNNTVKMAYEGAKFSGKNRAKAVARALAGGAATFLAPTVVIGQQAVKDYRDKRRAEQQVHKISTMTGCLRAYGISQDGATQMAHQVIAGTDSGNGNSINGTDFRMWMNVVKDKKELQKYTARIEKFVDDKQQDDAPADRPADDAKSETAD